MTDLATLRSACSQTGIEVVASLAQHRILSTAQVRAIHLPDRSHRWAQKLLARLGEAGLAGHIDAPNGVPRRLWHVTEHGTRLAREAGVLDGEPRLIGAEDAAGALQAHTLAVNDSAICFLAAARERGGEFGPFAWRQEVSHPLNYGRGRRRRALISDAVFTYLRLDGSGVAIEQRFLEIDRATLSVDRLAAELVRYAELHQLAGEGGEPLWRSRYPIFPPVPLRPRRRKPGHAGAPPLDRHRPAAKRSPTRPRTEKVTISFCLFEDLQAEGPFAPIFRDFRNPEQPIDWLGG